MKKGFKLMLGVLGLLFVGSLVKVNALANEEVIKEYNVLFAPEANSAEEGPEKMNDGNKRSNYHTKYGGNLQLDTATDNNYIVAELSTEKSITGFNYYGRGQSAGDRNGYIENFEIWVKTTEGLGNLADYTKIFTGHIECIGGWHEVRFDKAYQAKVIKLVVKSTYGNPDGYGMNKFICIPELQFVNGRTEEIPVEPPKVDVDLAKTKRTKDYTPILAPVAQGGYEIEKIKDGSLDPWDEAHGHYSSHWQTNLNLASASDNNAIIIELPAPRKVVGISYMGKGDNGGQRNGYINDFEVWTKATPGVGSPSDYTKQQWGKWQTSPTGTKHDALFNETEVQVIKLVAKSTDGQRDKNFLISCLELEVIEKYNFDFTETTETRNYKTIEAPAPEGGYEIERIKDGSNSSIYHSNWNVDLDLLNATENNAIIIELPSTTLVSGINYISREVDGSLKNGYIKDYELYGKPTPGKGVASDYTLLAKGTFEWGSTSEPNEHIVMFEPTYCQTIKLVAKSSYGYDASTENNFIHCAELVVYKSMYDVNFELNKNINESVVEFMYNGKKAVNDNEYTISYSANKDSNYTTVSVDGTKSGYGKIDFRVRNNYFANCYTKTSLALRYTKNGEEITPTEVNIRFGGRIPAALYSENKEYGVILLASNDKTNLAKLATPTLDVLNDLKGQKFVQTITPAHITDGDYYQFAWVVTNIPEAQYGFSFTAYLYELDTVTNEVTLAQPKTASINDVVSYYLAHATELLLPEDVVSALGKIGK